MVPKVPPDEDREVNLGVRLPSVLAVRFSAPAVEAWNPTHPVPFRPFPSTIPPAAGSGAMCSKHNARGSGRLR